MARARDCRHFIVKHDLDSLEKLPNFIWRTQPDMPSVLRRVKEGDRWISFAYINNERERRPISRIAGFFECTVEVRRRDIPLKPGDQLWLDPTHLWDRANPEEAWMIEGRACLEQPRTPVDVPPLDELLGRRYFRNAMLVPIKPADFDAIHKYVMGV